MASEPQYYIRLFPNAVGRDGVKRSVVTLGDKDDMEQWVAAIELRDEAKERLNDTDKRAIADFVMTIIRKKRETQDNKPDIIIVPGDAINTKRKLDLLNNN